MKRLIGILATGVVISLGIAACDSGVMTDPDAAPELAAEGASNTNDKVLVCHVGNKLPEYYATCTEGCGDAGKVDLIEVPASVAEKHLANPDHSYGGVSDYLPGDVGASSEGNEDADGDGVDEGCEIPSSYTVIDFGEASQTVGTSVANGARVLTRVNDGNGNNVFVVVDMNDTDEASDGGYHWRVYDVFSTINASCQYPIVQVRARAELGGTVFRIDFDGYETTGEISRDLDGPWDLANGDRPTLIVESVTLDFSVAPTTCF